MPRFVRSRTTLMLATATVALAVPATAWANSAAPDSATRAFGPRDQFHQTNLISDLGNQGARVVDPSLQNSWGLALGPSTPLWVADNGTSLATVYSISPGGGTAQKANITVTIPPADSSPTGQVFNPTSGFVVTTPAGSAPASFIFSSEGGQIIAWNSKADPLTGGAATATVEFSSPTAVYKGLAMASTRFGAFLYATNFHDGTVDVFDSHFRHVRVFGGFRDPFLPRGYAPFGIATVGRFLYVSYAQQDAARHDDVAGAGHGFIDVFTPSGFLVKRLASRGDLNSPWGLAVAPAGFGAFGGKLLVGNFGDGLIHAYNPFSGHLAGTLLDERRHPIQVDGLWGLKFGTATTGGTGTLLFSAGPDDEADGLVGAINPVP